MDPAGPGLSQGEAEDEPGRPQGQQEQQGEWAVEAQVFSRRPGLRGTRAMRVHTHQLARKKAAARRKRLETRRGRISVSKASQKTATIVAPPATTRRNFKL
jgi:hypothetical protein